MRMSSTWRDISKQRRVKMEVYNTKGVMIMYPLAFFGIMVILLNGYCCGAAVLVESNTTFRCDGRLDECLLEDDLQLEFLMNPYVSRLIDEVRTTIGNFLIPDSVVFHDCGNEGSTDYDSCIDILKGGNHACKKKSVYMKCGQIEGVPT